MTEVPEVPPPESFTVSTRDDDRLRDGLAAWLTEHAGTPVAVTTLDRPEGNGMSSDTVLFDAEWSPDAGLEAGESGGSFVARLEPSADAFPVFPRYDLAGQVRAMRLVQERTDVPVPTVRWVEPGRRLLGTPFFVMDRVDGRVPPDVMPYPMGSWLSEAGEEDRTTLVEATAAVLAGIHALEATPDELAFLDAGATGATGSSPLARHVDAERSYYAWVSEGRALPLIERGFAWLTDHWPEAADARPPTLCWGDARIGNIVYQGFTPAAVLDWEMATLAPPELDLGWTIFMHRFFQDLCEEMGLPGMPGFLDRDDVVEAYVRSGGREPVDLDWFITYAALRHGTIMVRVMGRQVFFGARDAPEDREEFILHRHSLDRMLEGAYWPVA
jgi:aminoglycoside phosphotransferase (APT) family kinase protein